MTPEEFINSLKEFDALREGDSVKRQSTDRIQPVFSEDDLLSELPKPLRENIDRLGIRLYEHQVRAIKKSLDGKNVVLESSTASGKTLSFFIPMLLRLIKNKDDKALLIYPMKALANDQRRQMTDLKIKGIESWIFDGDTDTEYRPLLKDTPP